MAYIVRDGVRVYFEDHGSGPGVLLSHGFCWSSAMWRDQVEALSGNYRVMTWDIRGHGRSDYPNATWPPIPKLIALPTWRRYWMPVVWLRR